MSWRSRHQAGRVHGHQHLLQRRLSAAPTYHNAQRPIEKKVDIMPGGRAARPIYIAATVVNLMRASTLADIVLKGL
jgi:hypothetical protein